VKWSGGRGADVKYVKQRDRFDNPLGRGAGGSVFNKKRDRLGRNTRKKEMQS